MSRKPTAKPTKCYAWRRAITAPLSEMLAKTVGRGEKPNALIVPIVPGHEWVLKPTAGKGRGKSPQAKEPKRG